MNIFLKFIWKNQAPGLGSLCLILWTIGLIGTAYADATYLQTNLVSDLPGLAAHTDSNLVNPWGISTGPTSPFWISNNKTGTSTIYDSQGQPSSLVVTVPPPAGLLPPSTPTGQVFNGSASFDLGIGMPAIFMFATENGTISAWNPGISPALAILKIDNSAVNAVYKGLAIGNNGTGDFLYAANFNAGTIDVFNSTFGPATLAGNFTDPNLPAGFAPFNIQNLGGKLYVAYALQDAVRHDDVPGPGNGFINVFDFNGNLLQRLVSNGPLNSPWGVALAPGNFGVFGNSLLVGNFGDGKINAFDPATGNFLGAMIDKNGAPIIIPGLWGLQFGNGGSGGETDKLYFTAGIPGPGLVEDHGLFGSLQPVKLWLPTILNQTNL